MDESITSEEAGRILEVGAEASESEIRSAYLTKVKQYPPERSPEEFQRVRLAYDLLRDPREMARRRWLKIDLSSPLADMLDDLAPGRKLVGPLAWLEAMGAS